MALSTVMSELKKMGTAQNVKVYKRHGAKEPLFGVSFANLKKLTKKYKNDNVLASGLWKTKNSDAKTLALMIADPKGFSPVMLDKWVKDVDYKALAHYFGALVGRTNYADSRIRKWIKSRDEFIKDVGFCILASKLKDDPSSISSKDCRMYIKYIEANIHKAPNRARSAMNMALIAIGIYKRDLTKTVITSARKIGKVTVDHGETSCKTPDAESYIKKALARG